MSICIANKKHDEEIFSFGLLFPLLLAFFALVLSVINFESNKNEIVINQQQVKNVIFIDDILSVSYVSSPSGQSSAENINKDDYWRYKAKFQETGKCYLVTYHNFVDSPLLEPVMDKNIILFECY